MHKLVIITPNASARCVGGFLYPCFAGTVYPRPCGAGLSDADPSPRAWVTMGAEGGQRARGPREAEGGQRSEGPREAEGGQRSEGAEGGGGRAAERGGSTQGEANEEARREAAAARARSVATEHARRPTDRADESSRAAARAHPERRARPRRLRPRAEGPTPRPSASLVAGRHRHQMAPTSMAAGRHTPPYTDTDNPRRIMLTRRG